MDYLQTDKNSTSQSLGKVQAYLTSYAAAVRGARIYNETILSISVMIMLISFVVFTVLQYNKWKAKAALRRQSMSLSAACSPAGSVDRGKPRFSTWPAESTLEKGTSPHRDITNLTYNNKSSTIANPTQSSSRWLGLESVV